MMKAPVIAVPPESYRARLAREHRERLARFFPTMKPSAKPALIKTNPTKQEPSPIPTAATLLAPDAPIVVITRSVLDDAKGESHGTPPTIELIQRVVARDFGFSASDLRSARRTQNVIRPRQIAMYLAKTLTLRSYPEIGRRFGGRDHTTVLHAVRKIEGLIAIDGELAARVAALSALISEIRNEAAAAAAIMEAATPPAPKVPLVSA